jgi:alginate O-acetyltransferase complex protein AlgI
LNQAEQMMPSIRKFLGWLLTFTSVVVAWVIFRAESIDSALSIMASMFAIENRPIDFKEVISGNFILVTQASGRDYFRLLILSFLAIWIYPYIEKIRVKSIPSRFMYFAAILTGLIYLQIINKFGQYSPFLYFQF